MAHPERLARTDAGLATLGRRLPGGSVRRALRQEEADRARGRTRSSTTSTWSSRPGSRGCRRPWASGTTSRAPRDAQRRWSTTRRSTAIWNHTGQPAASVPSEVAADGFPVGVQLVGRPGDEETLLSLAAQLEADAGWADRRPPLAA